MFNVKILWFLLRNIPRWYIFHTQHGKCRGWLWRGCWDISHLGGTDSFSEIRKAVEVLLQKKNIYILRTEGGEEISKTQTASTNILLPSPAYIFTFIPRKSYPHPYLSQASYNP